MSTHQLMQSVLFKRWYKSVSKAFAVNSIEIQSVDYVKRKGLSVPLFIKLKAVFVDSAGRSFSRICFLRGPSVAILVVLVCEGVEYVVLVNQAQPAVGLETFPGLPAGMLDDETIHSAALREIEEETGLRFLPEDLTDLSAAFYGGAWQGIYPSPGACDEIIHLFSCCKEVPRAVIESLIDAETGLRHEEQEYIILSVVKLTDVGVSTPDPKAHSAVMMYHHLMHKGT